MADGVMHVKMRLLLNGSWHWYGLLNFFVLQWFTVRLARVFIVEDSGKRRPSGWTWFGGIVPLTGWWDDFRYVGRRGK